LVCGKGRAVATRGERESDEDVALGRGDGRGERAQAGPGLVVFDRVAQRLGAVELVTELARGRSRCVKSPAVAGRQDGVAPRV
jgi:hypothetical protein